MGKLSDRIRPGNPPGPDPDRKINTEHGLHRPAAPIEAKDLVLGNLYTDTITGIKGVADAVYTFLTGCDQVSLNYLKDGDSRHIVVDASRIKELKEARAVVVAPTISEPPKQRPGGPARVKPPGSRRI